MLALTNRGDLPVVFHLHGHHFRLLDRLDDGWKPFWLDTLAIDSGQTERIAFAAELRRPLAARGCRDRLGSAAPACGGTVSSEETNMSASAPTIRGVKARAVDAPISRPVKNAFGVIRSAPLVLIDVATDQGITGRSYIFAYTRLTLKPLVQLIEEIGGELERQAGRAVRPDGGDGRAIQIARLAGAGRHGRVRPRHGVLGRARPGGGSAAGDAARRIAAADPGL